MPSMLCITLLLMYVAASSNVTAKIVTTTEAVEGKEGENEIRNLTSGEDEYGDGTEDNEEQFNDICEEELYEFTLVMGSGQSLLVYDPEEVPCINTVIEQKINGTRKKNPWERKECFSSYGAWNWYRSFIPGKENSFRIYDARVSSSLFYHKIHFLPETPPPVAAVEAEVGRGFVAVYITPPEEAAYSILGYRVSLLDLERSLQWQVVGVFENVVYHCTLPELRPVHPCPQWKTTRVFCAVFSDRVWWTNNDTRRITNETMKFVKVETFRIPTEERDRIYSEAVQRPLNTSMAVAVATESGATEADEGELAAGWLAGVEGEGWEDAAWVAFLTLSLALLLGALPLAHHLAVRDGRNDTKNLWHGQTCGHDSSSKSLMNCLDCCFHNKISYEGKERLRFRGFKRKGPHPGPDPDRVPETIPDTDPESDPELD